MNVTGIQSLNGLYRTHLTEDISGKEISKIVGLSDYHFKRMFSYMAGMSLSEYIKNRRLSVANVELINGAKVTDIAYNMAINQ